MEIAQPETFALTDAEAAAVQSVQMARQAAIAKANPVLRYGALAAPVVVVGVVAAIDVIWYRGDMPVSLFVTLMAVFVAGMIAQTIGYRLSLAASKKRLRQASRQVLAPRTVRLTDEGLSQALADTRAVYLWASIDDTERTQDLVLVWTGNLLAAAIPARAFRSGGDADAFVAEIRRRAAGPQRSARA